MAYYQQIAARNGLIGLIRFDFRDYLNLVTYEIDYFPSNDPTQAKQKSVYRDPIDSGWNEFSRNSSGTRPNRDIGLSNNDYTSLISLLTTIRSRSMKHIVSKGKIKAMETSITKWKQISARLYFYTEQMEKQRQRYPGMQQLF